MKKFLLFTLALLFVVLSSWAQTTREVPGAYATIQAAIDASAAGDVISVAAGTYKELLTVGKSLDIRGPNYGINPNSGTRVGEAIIMQPDGTDDTKVALVITADNVSIEGFTFEGDNPTITGTYNAAKAMVVNNSNHVQIKNNLIENFWRASIDADGTSGINTDINIQYNRILNTLGKVSGYGSAIFFGSNTTGTIDNNSILNCRRCVYFDYNPNGGVVSITNNVMDATLIGLFMNRMSQYGASSITISNNSITSTNTDVLAYNANYYVGMILTTNWNYAGNSFTLSNNTLSGKFKYGVLAWNNAAPINIVGGSIDGTQMQVAVRQEALNATWGAVYTGGGGILTLDGVAISNAPVGVWVDDNGTGVSYDDVKTALVNGTSITGGVLGVKVSGSTAGSTASISGNTLNNTSFTGQTGNYIEIVNNTLNIDATGALFEGKTGANATAAENCTIEDKILHKMDNTALGLVRVKALELFVTTASGTIQRGIELSASGEIVNVAAGTYEELIVIDKLITLNGPNATIAGNGSRVPEALIQFPTGAADESGLIYVGTNLSGVTIAGFDLKCQDATIASGLFGYYLILTEKVNNLTIRNNRMYSSVIPMYILTDNSMTDYRTGLMVEGNYVDCGPNVNNSYNRGIYVQATSGTIQDNQFLNTSIGIQYMPYGHTTSALIQRNTITAGSRGLYHNYQNKGAAQVTWSQNEVSVAPNDRAGLKAQVYGAWTQQLTFRGMEAITFGTQGSGAAPQVYFNNNKVDGNIASSPYYTSTIGYRTTDASATGVATLTGNSFTNLNMGVVNNSSVSVAATCNWWGTTVPAEIAAKITGSATYIPYSVSDGGACEGAPVVVRRSGSFISSHTTIQSAIDAATTQAGDVINVAAGTYPENLSIGKSVTILGPNAGISPNGTGRLAEAIIQPLQGFDAIIPTANSISVVLKGVTVDMASTVEENRYLTLNSKTNTGWTFEKNIFKNAKYSTNGSWWFSGSAVSNLTLNDNYFTANAVSNGLMVAVGCPAISITNNVWEDNGYTALNLNNVVGTISGNIFRDTRSVNFSDPNYYFGDYQSGILLASANNNLNIVGNTFTNVHYGVILYQSADGTINITDNDFDGTLLYSVRLSSSQTGGDLNDVTLSGNSFLNYAGSNTEINNVRTDGQVLNATCNWFGTTDPYSVAAAVTNNVQFLPFSTSANPMNCTGYGPVVVYEGSTSNVRSSFMTIQPAINAATAGDVITVAAGTYTENIDVSKALTILGPNASVTGNGTRITEALVEGPFLVNANNVTIKGFYIDGTNVNQTPDLSKRGVLVGNVASQTNVTIENNIIKSWVTGVSLAGGYSFPWNETILIRGNKFMGTSIGSTENVNGLSVLDNYFDNAGVGFGGGAILTALTGNTFINGTGRYVSAATGVVIDFNNVLAVNTFDKTVYLNSATGQWYDRAIFTKINSAAAVATAGATVLVSAGTFNENVTVNKRITLNGAGATTIITSAAATTPVMTITASGANATDRLVISNLKVTGATGLENPGAGILVQSATASGYYTFTGVEASGNQGSGIAFNNTASVTDVIINNCNLSSNGFGLRIATAVPSFDGLTLTGSQMNNNASSAFNYNPSGNLTNVGTNFSFTDCSFANNSQAGVSNQHDLSFFGFHGNASLTNVSVTSSNGPSTTHKAYGIVFTNASAYAAAGAITLNGVTINGTVGKGALSFQFYNDMSNVSLTNVDISGCTAPWGQLLIDQSGTGIFNIGNTTLKTIGIWKTANVDATSAIFKHATTGAILDRNTLSDCYQIEDQIAHKIDLSTLGLVTVKVDNLFVTTNSYASPYTTTPSIQRGIDAATAGNTVNVAAGTFNESLLALTKSLTLKGANAGVPAAVGTGVTPSGRGAETILTPTNGILPNASDITIDGFHLKRSERIVTSNQSANNFKILNNIIENTSPTANEMLHFYGAGLTRNDWEIKNNMFIGPHGGTGTILFSNNGFERLKIEANDFKGDGETALWGEGDNIVIKGNYFGPTNLTGMNCNGLNNPTIENNYVEVNGYGFQLTTSNGGILQNNTFIGVQADYYDGINYLRGIDVFGTRFSGPNSNGLIIRNNTFQDFTSSGTINPDDQYRGIHIRQGATGITITGNEFINTHTGLGIVSATPAVSGIIMTGNDLSGVQLGVNNGSANNVDATNNYWGTCPSVSGIATYFPYWSTISGTPGSFVFDNPINNITASASSATICLGQSVTLSGATGSNFEWFNPAGTSLGLGVNKVVTPAASGSLTYTVTGKDLNGCAGGTASATFTVNPALVAEITQTGTGPYTLTATAGSSYTYAWSNGATTQSITVNPAVTSTFSVIITSGPCTASASKTIDVVYVSAGANQSICPGGSAQLNATISGVTPTLYAWSPATGLSNTAIANPVATPASTTTYTVTINATYTAAVTITVRPKPTANAGDDKTIFVGQSTVLTGVGSLGTPSYNYIWTPGSLTTASITVSPAATQTYNLVVTDAFGCASDADQATVTVNAMPASGNTVTGTISYAFGTVNAQMHDVAITLTPVLGGASYTGTSAASGNGTYSIPGVPDATYYVYLHSPKPWGGVTSADITAIANHYRASRPCLLTGIKRLAGDVYLNSAAASVNVDDKNEVQARINNSAYTFPGDWVFTKTSDISVNPFPAQFANDGYSGGSAFSSIQIIVAAATPASLVNNFSALCYGDVNASYNGVKTTEINNPTVYDGTTEDWFELSNYPNPFVGQTNFTYNQAVEGEATIQIFNLMGGLMGKIVNPDRSEGSHKIAFDGSRLAPGIYIYVFTLRTKDDVLTQNGKMVIVK